MWKGFYALKTYFLTAQQSERKKLHIEQVLYYAVAYFWAIFASSSPNKYFKSSFLIIADFQRSLYRSTAWIWIFKTRIRSLIESSTIKKTQLNGLIVIIGLETFVFIIYRFMAQTEAALICLWHYLEVKNITYLKCPSHVSFRTLSSEISITYSWQEISTKC